MLIKNVIPMKGYRLGIQLTNDSDIILSLRSRLATVRFNMLADEAFFNEVTTDGNFIRWGDKVEISIGEVFQLARK